MSRDVSLIPPVKRLHGLARVIAGCKVFFEVGHPVVNYLGPPQHGVHGRGWREVVCGVAGRLMLVPARSQVDPVTSELLGRTKSRILPLDDLVAVDAEARWIGQRPAAELLREFRLGIFGEDGPVVPATRFPTPPDARWEEVSIRFITQHQVHVRVRGEASAYEHTQMGMASKRNDQPTKQWELLQLFAENRGEITWESPSADRDNAHRRLALARQLRQFFGIEGDPFKTLPRGHGWRTRFTIIPET